MNKVNFHPQPELLAAFSAGSLPMSQALCVAVHLDSCAECRQHLNLLNRLGSELLAQQEPADVPEVLRQRVMARVSESPDRVAQHSDSSHTRSDIPRCLSQFIPTDYESLSWQKIGRGILTSELCRDIDNAKVELIKIKAGRSIFSHTHLGDEYTVVLEGSFSDESGVYRRGDFMLKDRAHTHTPVATQDGDCICLTVTHAPIQFAGFFSRLLNPFVRRSYA